MTNPLTVTEDQQRYYSSKLKSVGPSFASAFGRRTVYDYSAEDDIDLLVGEICRTYANVIRRHNFKYHVFSRNIELVFTDGHKTFNPQNFEFE